MKPRRRSAAVPAVLLGLGLLAFAAAARAQDGDASFQSGDAPVATEPDADDSFVPAEESASAEDNAQASAVQALGEPGQKLYVVDHGAHWSMHAENLATDVLLRLWQQAGGPEVISKTLLDRAYTISVHRLGADRIMERLLDGYGYTLHYDENGRLVRVRVYSPVPGPVFKTPRLVESLTKWNDEATTSSSQASAP
ncbi:MAG: hypothetical protein ABR538_04730 [Candidatus Binatia bacterium]